MQEESSNSKVVFVVFGLAATALLLLLMLGCGRRGDDASAQFVKSLVPLTGTVTQGGKPVPEVLVTYFVDQSTGSSGSSATGLTDKDGKYSLMTVVPGRRGESAAGAVPGDYRVIITKLVQANGEPVPPDTTDADAEAMGAKQLLPPKYSSLTATKLTAKVEATTAVKDFQLDK